MSFGKLKSAGVFLLILALSPFLLCLLVVFICLWPFFALWTKYRRATSRSPWHWLRSKLGWGRGVKRLARLLQMDVYALEQFVPQYREFTLPKRSGGVRTICAPDAATKKLQRTVLRSVLGGLRAHPAARAYERGVSIVDNALPHVGQAVVIKLDAVDFFPTTAAARVERYFRRIGWSAKAAACLSRIVCHNGGLPQGAPTSPRLANLVNYYLDWQLTSLARRRKGEYTRYADDLTFSFPEDYPRRIRGVVQGARRILKVHGYRLNTKKTRILRRHQRQMVTGLVVNRRPQLPREVRRRLRAMKHRMSSGRATRQSAAQCQGWLGLEKMVAAKSTPVEHTTGPS